MAWFRRKKKKIKRFASKWGKKAFRKTPYGRAYTAAKYGYRGGKYAYGRLKRKQTSRIGGKKSRIYDTAEPTQSRRGSTSSSQRNRYRRGQRQFYYYRGRKYYRRR